MQRCNSRRRVIFSIFIDRLSEKVTPPMVEAIFNEVGRLKHVFVQKRRKEGRRFKVGFFMNTADKEVWNPIRRFNGLRIEGVYLEVKKALYQGSVNKSFSYQSKGDKG